MRKLLLFAAIMLLTTGLFAQATAYSDNFEVYTVGEYLAVQSDSWTTWSNDPGSGEDALISDEQALSGTKSVKVEGITDLLKKLGNKTSGTWWVEINMYIPATHGGYYNLQKYEAPGTEWGVQAYFQADGTGTIDAGAEGAVEFEYDPDTWIEIVNVINLDNDVAQVWFDGELMVEWPWSLGTFGDPGVVQLGGINMYSGEGAVDDPLYYFDDVLIEQLSVPFYQDDFESYAPGDFIAESTPTWWTTWGNDPGSPEDAYVVDTYSNSPVQSLYIDPDDGLTDLILKLGDKVSGAYEVNWAMYVESGYNGYYNFQHFEAPGTEWAFEIWYYDGGDGDLLVGGENFAFTFPQDEWFDVSHVIDIDNDVTELYVDGTLVHTWPFSYEGGSANGTPQLGGVDFWTDDETYRYYIDDVYYAPIPINLYIDDFEDYTLGDYIAVANPEWWTTWSNDPGSDEDALIVDDYAQSPVQSIVCNYEPGATDLVMKLGDRVSGAYELGWYVYVESGASGYYNIQHFEAPGTEWAFELYFNDDGTGELYAGYEDPFAFTYTPDTWIPVMHSINLDDDWIVLSIADQEIFAWPFSWQSDEQSGTLQLGGVNFYTSDGDKFYIDDVKFIQTTGELDPVIEVSPDELEGVCAAGSMVTTTLSVTNSGASPLEWEGIVIYDFNAKKSAPVAAVNTPVIKLSHSKGSPSAMDIGLEPVENPGPHVAPQREEILTYAGDPAGAYYSLSPPTTYTAAAMFPPDIVNPYIGMYVTAVEVFVNELNQTHSNAQQIKIYDMGSTIAPGEELASKIFLPILGWNYVELDEPIYVEGGDLWVGWWFTQAEEEVSIGGIDAGPADPNGDWISRGVGWSHLGFDQNHCIIAYLDGEAAEQWLSIDPSMGTLDPGESADITVTMDATNLTEGTYEGIIRILSNDPENESIDVPVTFTVGAEPESIVLDFEDIPDFSTVSADFAPWSVNDVDGLDTWGSSSYDFPGEGGPMAFMCFNPDMTDPPATNDAALQPYEGEKFGACFSSAEAPWNNDWLISPQVFLGASPMINFFAKSYTDQYGEEEFKVGVSTTGMNPEDFTIISGNDPLTAPAAAWEEVEFDLSDYTNQNVYVAIQCVSVDHFIFMVDYVTIQWDPTSVPEPGESQASITVYPNPATDQINLLSSEEISEIAVYNYLGQMVYSEVVGNNEFRMNTSNLKTGIYYIRIHTETGMTTRKVMVR